jgi:hypothetical protein
MRENVDAVETCRVGPEVRDPAADQCLHQKKQAHHDEVLDGCALAWRRMMRQHRRPAARIAVPSEKIKAAERKQHRGDAAQQREQAYRAPQDGVADRHVAGQRVVREVIGVRVNLSRPPRGARPGRPREESGQLAQLIGILDQPRRETPIAIGRGEVIAPFCLLGAERIRFSGGEDQGVRSRVIPIFLQRMRHLGVEFVGILG